MSFNPNADFETKHLTPEQLLLAGIKELASGNNYEPYEKDYGEGVGIGMKMPYIGSSPAMYAESVVAAYRRKKQEPTKLSDMQVAYIRMLDFINELSDDPEVSVELTSRARDLSEEARKWI